MSQMRITGIVRKNLGRGKKLGFPTVNIDLEDSSSPDGIYIALTRLNGEAFKSLAFIGAPEMFGETKKKLEVYLLDFNRDIYGQEISVQLLEKIRGNQKFSSESELIAQMKIDEKQASEFFKTYGRIE